MIKLDLTGKISRHFTYHECLWLPKWNRMGEVSDGLNDDVIRRLGFLAIKMDQVRDFVAVPIVVHVWWRPPAYNTLIGGAPSSTHMAQKGDESAVDFHVRGYEGAQGCNNIRKLLLPHLETWELRMEDKPNGNWIHLDSASPRPNRFFKP